MNNDSTCRNLLQEAAQLINQGKRDQAAAHCRQAIDSYPDEAEGYRLLAAIYYFQQQYEPAVTLLRQAIALSPQNAALAYDNLSVIYRETGRFQDAEAAARQGLSQRPSPEALNNLALVLHSQQRFVEAENASRQSLALHPRYAEAENTLALTLLAQTRHAEALGACSRALTINPHYVEALNNQGIILQQQGMLGDAGEAYKRALSLQLGRSEIAQNLKAVVVALYEKGTALQNSGKLAAARQAHREALALDPHFFHAPNSIGLLLREAGQLEESNQYYREALALKPNYLPASSNLLFNLHYRPGVTPAMLDEAHREWYRRDGEPFIGAWPHYPNSRDPNRCLRIGLVSPDFGEHPVGYFLVRALEAFDREQYILIAYVATHSDGVRPGALSERIKTAVSLWRDCDNVLDEEFCSRIRADEIDILIDLSGHTSGNRLAVFARKPAPIQVGYIGYPGSTGLASMDYIIADRFIVPEDTDRHYREKILRLPDSFICFDPPAIAAAVGGLPVASKGFITFGSFNHPAKINGEVVAVWADILKRVPGSRLLLKYTGFGDPACQHHFTELFAREGIAADRLAFQGRTSLADMFAQYNEVDIALDPFPFNGGVTTCFALWMGVPVLTWPKETFAGRQSLSFLSTIGMTQTIAASREAYVEKAAALAADIPGLAALRKELRPRMAASALCDGKRMAAQLQTLLRGIWRDRCAQPADRA